MSAEVSKEDNCRAFVKADVLQVEGLVEDSADVTMLCAISIADLQAAFPEIFFQKVKSLPHRVKTLVADSVNKLLLRGVEGSVVAVNLQAMMILRRDMIASVLPDIIQNAIELDEGIYITYEGDGKAFVLDLTDAAASEFPFAGTSWPHTLLDDYKIRWFKLSDTQRDAVVELMRNRFSKDLTQLGLVDEEASFIASMWESWGLIHFKASTLAVLTKDMPSSFVFQPEISVDIMKGEEVIKNVVALKERVTELHDTFIKEEVSRRKAVLRQQFPSLDAVEFERYEKAVLEQEYWKIVMQVVEGTSFQPSKTEASEARALEEPRRKVARLESAVGHAEADARQPAEYEAGLFEQ